MTGPQADRDRRLAFAIPPMAEPSEEIEWLDPADADDRALLIAAAHPELDTETETALVEGHEINPRLHLTVHEIVASQIVEDDPPGSGRRRSACASSATAGTRSCTCSARR
jgi:hypothetical protein